MLACVRTTYGSPDVLRIAEVATPTPKDKEVLVRIHAASVSAGDWHLLRGDPFPVRFVYGLLRPKHHILGSDVAGVVEAVGKDVTQFRPGDAVFGDVSRFGFGGFAEYLAAPEQAFALKPTEVSFEQAAAVPVSAVTALQALRNVGQIQAGQDVLIYGASGGVGTFAVQIAKAFGATVTAVCSTRNLEIVRSLGADRVIDYTKEDFTTQEHQYDLIIAVNGYHPLSVYRSALRSQGRYVMVGGSSAQMFEAMLLGPWLSRGGQQTLTNMLAKPNQQDLNAIKDLLAAGKVVPVLDKQFGLGEVPEAIRHVEAGHARGKVVVTIGR